MAAETPPPPWRWQETIGDPAWIDGNGHLNVAYYALVFDHALEALQESLGVGVGYRQAAGGAVFVVETLTRFHREVRLGATLVVHSWCADADAKRALLVHRLHLADAAAAAVAGEPVAVQEAVCIHVALSHRRAAPWPPAVEAELARWVRAAPAPAPLPSLRLRRRD